MNIRKQSIFDKYENHKDKISDVICIEKHGIVSKVRKVQFIYNTVLYVPCEFVCVIKAKTKDSEEFYTIDNFYDINYFEDDLNDYSELEYTFINLNPSVIEPSSNDELSLISTDITYKRDYDAFMIGLCTSICINFKDRTLMNLVYNYVYSYPDDLKHISENTVWIYECGNYIPSYE